MNYYIRNPYQISAVLKNLRLEYSLTQKEVSERTGVLPKTISAIENGNITFKMETFMRLLSAYRKIMVLENIEEPSSDVFKVDW
ncbi:MAG: helix-turn-helix transcriptional regulator [Sphaerochaetaceae bacterium]|jgi:HTH-type transcriptional regulator/antitoxin HipB|nr:helix-turn-helix transcriptional regulator [Sphaerochaetaceae bacterium]